MAGDQVTVKMDEGGDTVVVLTTKVVPNLQVISMPGVALAADLDLPAISTATPPDNTVLDVDIFLSYCVCDTGNKRGGDGTAYAVKDRLEKEGWKVFMDNNLEGGDDWGAVINMNVAASKCMVALSSTRFAVLRPDPLPMAGTSWTLNEVRA